MTPAAGGHPELPSNTADTMAFHKERPHRLQCMTWSSRATTHTCTASMRRCFICCYGWGWCHWCVIPILFLVLFVIHPPFTLSTLFPARYNSKEVRSHRCEHIFKLLRCCWNKSSNNLVWTIDSALIVAVTVGHWSCRVETRVIPLLR